MNLQKYLDVQYDCMQFERGYSGQSICSFNVSLDQEKFQIKKKINNKQGRQTNICFFCFVVVMEIDDVNFFVAVVISIMNELSLQICGWNMMLFS